MGSQEITKRRKIMDTSKISPGLIALVTVLAIGGFVTNVSAQEKIERCRPSADQIYFVDSGRSVTEVRPGNNGGNGYQLNILGAGVDEYQVVKEPYMTALSLISASHTQAKWQVFFAPKMGRSISSVRMTALECTGRRPRKYQLTESVRLLDQ
jgi:hypothetical protein